MDNLELHRKLIAAARAVPPDDRVPLAFQQRIMARLAGKRVADAWTLWGQALTRSAVFCVAFAVFLAVATWYFIPSGDQEASSQEPTSLAQDLQRTLIASVDTTPDPNGDLQ